MTKAMQGALLDKLRTRTATIGVIGQGYVGLPLSLVFAEEEFTVLGFDVDPAKTDTLNAGESYIPHIDHGRVAAARQAAGRTGAPTYLATTDFSRLAECHAVLICVPTPLGPHRDPDLSYVHRTAEQIARHLRPGTLVVLESTTYPGTTEEEVQPILEGSGLKTPQDFFLAFSPEREDPGNPRFNTRTIPKVVGGVNEASTRVAAALYAEVVEEVVPVGHAKIAESSKLLENIYRSVNIALVNELKLVFERMGINIWEVIEAAETKPFGFEPFYPGPGLGGHCIPLDPFYLSWKASEYGHWTRFIELAGEINTRMPAYVVDKTAEALNDGGKSIKGAGVLVLGLSYKPNIGDDRESPSYEIMELLRDRGAEVAYCDPHIDATSGTRRHPEPMSSRPIHGDEFARYDCLVLCTPHREFADAALYRDVPLLVDTRNAIDPAWVTRLVRA